LTDGTSTKDGDGIPRIHRRILDTVVRGAENIG
jgi:hypothetical protein